MRSYLLGGGFGHIIDGDYAVPAALASLRRSAESRSRRFSPAPMTCVLIARALPRNNSFAWPGETMAA